MDYPLKRYQCKAIPVDRSLIQQAIHLFFFVFFYIFYVLIEKLTGLCFGKQQQQVILYNLISTKLHAIKALLS